MGRRICFGASQGSSCEISPKGRVAVARALWFLADGQRARTSVARVVLLLGLVTGTLATSTACTTAVLPSGGGAADDDDATAPAADDGDATPADDDDAASDDDDADDDDDSNDDDASGDDDDATEAPDVPFGDLAGFAASGASLQRLTRVQYGNAVRDVLGEAIVVPSQLEPDFSVAGFLSVGASETTISPRGVEQFSNAAYDIAKQALRDEALRARNVKCTPAGTKDEACAKETLTRVGRMLWRRNLTTEEVDALTAIATKSAETLGDFYLGLEFGLAALLQSPNFLFRVELGEVSVADPTSSVRAYTSNEMASRLAFFLWNTTPDDGLLAKGAEGKLASESDVRREARAMLDGAKARSAVRNFFTEYLELYKLDDNPKDPKVYPQAAPELALFAREETLLGLEKLVFDYDGDFREILTTRRTYVNRDLAALYGVPAPAKEGFAETLLPLDGPRRGLLGQASFLSLKAHTTSSSATLRGLFIRKVLLCGEIPAPPANVSTQIPEPSPTTPTLRERIAIHLEEESCAQCHLAMDPLGLGLENFDGIGRYRTTENGATIDASGDVDGVPFKTPAELGLQVALSPKLGTCFARNVYRYAVGHKETDEEEVVIEELAKRFEASGYRVKSLFAEVAASPGFRLAGEPR